MKEKSKLPKVSSLNELADFWDENDLTDYEQEFVEVTDLKVNLKGRTYLPITLKMYQKLEEIARNNDLQVEQLIRSWLQEKIQELS